MAASVVLPLESRIQQWHDTEHKFQLRPTLSETPRLLSDSMARPLPAAEPREDAFSRRPSLPPFSKFLSDAGHPELFTQPRTPQIRTEPSLSAGAALNSHVIQLNSFRPSELHSGARTEQLPPTRNGHTEMQNGRTWSYPSTSPVGSHLSIPGTAPTKMSGDRATGPAVLREEVIPGRGPCYVYEDGAVVQKIINGDTVNPKWGTTKAGKPRKRLGQACNTCREKKIKCDPSVPKCAQCQKFGRECKFDSTYVTLIHCRITNADLLTDHDLDLDNQARLIRWPCRHPARALATSSRSTLLEEGPRHLQTWYLKNTPSLEQGIGPRRPWKICYLRLRVVTLVTRVRIAAHQQRNFVSHCPHGLHPTAGPRRA